MSTPNYSIRDEIREFWSERSKTFDQDVGHEIFSEAERRGWRRLIGKHLGPGDGRAVLDLACGTAVISHLLHGLGFRVTGADWAEGMLERARLKAEARSAPIRFIMRDAENTLEPDGTYDAITNRHLVWTLVDPPAAFAEWFRVLKPGGKLLIVDVNSTHAGLGTRLRDAVAKISGRPKKPQSLDPAMVERLRLIRKRLYFSTGMPAETIVGLLTRAGFVDAVIDRAMLDIHWAQARKMTPLRALERLTQDRFAICASKPLGAAAVEAR